MKTTVVLVALAAFCCLSSSYAQGPLWTQTNGPGGSQIMRINFDSSGGVYVLCNRTLRSTDGGLSWNEISPVAAMVTLPNGDLFTGTKISKDFGQTWTTIAPDSGSWTTTLAGEILIVANNRLLRSTNEGKSWDSSLVAPPTGDGFLFSFYSSTLFWETNDYIKVLYRSTDKGKSWSKLVNGLVSGAGLETGGTSFFVAYSNGPFVSTDDGRTWQRPMNNSSTTGAYLVAPNNRIAVYSESQITLLDSNFNTIKSFAPILQDRNGWTTAAASPQGEFWYVSGTNLYKPNAAGSKLSYVSLPVGIITALIAQGTSSVLAYSGIYTEYPSYWAGMLYKTSDGGPTWSGLAGTVSNFEGEEQLLGPFAFDSTHALLSSRQGSIVKSVDHGSTWNPLGSPLSKQITSIVVDPDGYIYASSDEGVFRSTDRGVTWDQLNYGLSNPRVKSLAVNSSGHVFAGTSTAIYRSTDHALTWQSLPFLPPDTSGVICMTVNTAGDVLAAVKSGGIYWSQSNGNLWGSIGQGLKGKVNAMLSTPSGHVFAATDQGIYYLEAGGGSWTDANAGLTNTNVLSITRDPAGTVYLGTAGSGVFRSTQTYNIIKQQSAVHRVNDVATQFAVYPNPVASSAMVTFSVPAASVARVELLNALGEVVKGVAEENVAAGSYQSSLDASDLANGVYHLRLITSEGVMTQNVVIVK